MLQGTDQVDEFLWLFGDERQDYGRALDRHHQTGRPG
ncbi:MAG: hypothetical protein JO114_22245 [Planctomycetaceae bacterium]|nr:hypothetical protein [Planctomycetaceae bacterium]